MLVERSQVSLLLGVRVVRHQGSFEREAFLSRLVGIALFSPVWCQNIFIIARSIKYRDIAQSFAESFFQRRLDLRGH